jgi:hypothetical protein
MDLYTRTCLVDIYIVKTKNIHNTQMIEGTNITPNFNNVLEVLPNKAIDLGIVLNKNNNCLCKICLKVSLFVYDSFIGFICPQCFHNQCSRIRHCSICKKKAGCDTCGGKSKYMYEIEDKLLCSQDRCLMPFGYYYPNPSLECFCEQDILKALKSKLTTNMCSIVSKIITTTTPLADNYLQNKNIILGDLSSPIKNRCVKCQISSKYINIRQIGQSVGKNNKYIYICSC